MHNGFDKEDLQAPLSEINMTPLVDVMLVLLIIFLITAPILTSTIQLNLPKDSGISTQEKDPITISITKNGEYFLEERDFSIKDLEEHLKEIAQENVDSQINIRADTDAQFGKVSHVLSIAQKLGLKNVGFITKPN
jgi:biopolymer transport protein ExbD